MDIKHFVVDHGYVREFSADEGAEVASGSRLLPEYADCKIRYVQVVVGNTPSGDDSLQVQIAGAYLKFDDQGRLFEAEAQGGDDIDRFEHETCVQLALLQRFPESVTIH